ncbi:MAG: MauE/DoxX family redox-associated membrane protein [Paenibacillus dendritiformis]|uniref:MauE/DoxX family redox-associated membrane protein n=1 Tax=Paenibacillus dendritiformis TaxID=130049 RepID=UPI001F1A2DFB|nr:MauE/DoxX family redox-associated membrane protein [Paenibacillus dendritiformis]MDU5142788.1 MauE/DoxX family redox-associated membrane protein [Paenibacillus dendritiformis]
MNRKHNGMCEQQKEGAEVEALSVFCRLLLALIFISSCVSTLRQWHAHIGIIKDYDLLPEALVKWFAVLEHSVKWLVGMLLFWGSYSSSAAITGSGLLLIYSIAIMINLLRGTREISCGCGGIVGNHSLSWTLVLRNLLLMAMCLWVNQVESQYGSLILVIKGEDVGSIFGKEYWVILGSALLSALLYSIFQHLIAVHKRIRELLGRMP